MHRRFCTIHETGMELAKSPAENWASDVEQLLGYMLAMPKADHAEEWAVRDATEVQVRLNDG